jgi:hypothetical protein
MLTEGEIKDLAGLIYDTFSIEKKVFGYHSDRVIARDEFIDAMLVKKNLDLIDAIVAKEKEARKLPDPNYLLKVIVEIPVYSNPAVLHGQGVNPNWTSTEVNAIGDTMIEVGNRIKQGFTGRIAGSGINWRMEIGSKRR